MWHRTSEAILDQILEKMQNEHDFSHGLTTYGKLAHYAGRWGRRDGKGRTSRSKYPQEIKDLPNGLLDQLLNPATGDGKVHIVHTLERAD